MVRTFFRLILPLAFITVALGVCLSPASSSASGGWDVILDRPTPDFGGIDFVSNSQGWLVAGAGLLHTTDGGATWTEAAAITGIKVDFADSQHGWLVGFNGTIYATRDGANWSQQVSGTGLTLTDVVAMSSQEAWVVGELFSDAISFPIPTVLLHTTDGGISWQHVATPPNTWFSQITFVGKVGWAFGGSCTPPPATSSCSGPTGGTALLQTTDGGTTWSLAKTDLPGSVQSQSLDFVSTTHGWLTTHACIAGSSECQTRVYRTTDGGTTWQFTDLSPAWLRALAFENETTGWIVAQDCDSRTCSLTAPTTRILKTTDGGVTWTEQGSLQLPSSQQYVQSLSLRSNFLYVTGPGVAKRSGDGGVTWQPMDQPALELDAIDLVNRRAGYMLSKGDLLRTDDAGHSWNRIGVAPEGTHVIEFLDDARGFVAGAACSSGSCILTVWRTGDGGQSWTPVGTAQGPSAFPRSLQFSDDKHGWVVMGSGVLTTEDGGATWTEQFISPGSSILSAELVDSSHAWAIIATTGSPYVFQLALSTDGGRTWGAIRQLSGQGDAKIDFVDSEHGWYSDYACLANSCAEHLYSTDDGGITWRELNPGVDYINSLAFVDQLNGWMNVARGCGGVVLHTADGGQTWTSQLTGELLIGTFDFADVDTGWLALSNSRCQGLGGGPPNRTVLYHTADAGGGPIGLLVPTPSAALPRTGSGTLSSDTPGTLGFGLLLTAIGLGLVGVALTFHGRKTWGKQDRSR